MIKPLALNDLAERFGGEVIRSLMADAAVETGVFTQLSTDTRSLQPGDLFVALKGERFDAHDYLDEAVAKGATGLVVNRQQLGQLPTDSAYVAWSVEDTTLALGYMGEYQRDAFDYPVIAVTGSSGKTTVKGMLQSVFAEYAGAEAVFATQGNFNNHIGVPLSLLSLTSAHRFAIIEMGASAGGEIGYLTAMAKPAVAMVNNVMAAHVEGFGSVDAIAVAKGEIYNGLIEGGVAVINGDDVYAPQWIEQNQNRQRCVFSTNVDRQSAEGVDVTVQHIEACGNGCYRFELMYGQTTIPVTLNVLGKHNINNATAAASCALSLGLDADVIAKGLQQFRGDPGRLQLVEGQNAALLIDDSYNANPGSARAAVDVLASVTGKTILVLGDMAELGDDAATEHRELGRYAAEKNITHLFTLGDMSALAAHAFGANAHHCKNIDEIIVQIMPLLDADVSVLVKGSRSSRMERVIHALKISEKKDAGLAG